jgi:ABC-type enterochelin transport system substrate-binding protein
MLTTEIINLDVCVYFTVYFRKSKVLTYLDEIDERLITEVGSVKEKNEEKINREKHEICQLTSILKDNKQELEFLNNDFFCFSNFRFSSLFSSIFCNVSVI